MKLSRKTLIVAFVLIAAVLLTSCGQAQSASANAPAQSATAGASANEQNTIYGNVTAISGSNITLALGTLNMAANPSGQPGVSGAPSGNGQNGQSNSSTRPSGMPSGGQQASMLTLTGETRTITVTDESVISLPGMGQQNGQQSAQPSGGQTDGQNPQFSSQKGSLADIQVGSMLRVVYASDNTTIQSIVIMNGFNRGNSGGQNTANASGAPSAPAA